jgi:hypothetical protein
MPFLCMCTVIRIRVMIRESLYPIANNHSSDNVASADFVVVILEKRSQRGVHRFQLVMLNVRMLYAVVNCYCYCCYCYCCLYLRFTSRPLSAMPCLSIDPPPTQKFSLLSTQHRPGANRVMTMGHATARQRPASPKTRRLHLTGSGEPPFLQMLYCFSRVRKAL